MNQSPNELFHFGIKGMRWGVRRYQDKSGRLTSAGKKKRLTKDQYKVKSRKKDLANRRTMSTEELKHKIERLKLEKEFKSLTNEDIAPGKAFAKDIMSSAGKKVLTMAAAGAMAYGVKAAMEQKFDIKAAAKFIAANPNQKKG